MASKLDSSKRGAVAAWAKRSYFAGRAVLETMLRPHGLGSTQWYVLYQLAHDGPTMQRDLLRILQIERATLSGVVGALVRAGLVEQIPDQIDQRQKRLQLTKSGAALWATLPDPISLIHHTAFEGFDDADLETAARVLRIATERLDALSRKGPSQ
ncbi:MarR family winged helix-turn-helix transcriptional regulator [Novosphingobium kaempferiae]|uniref:MarR family winged helix-turn-helix transcriptional regulator n=1 Tax=Novosphingobium kaempferiae TaxID=2896849 RepID=UPI001E2C8922|nr:MarR family transcriptional regulator [Novosphingobium kaempferiae]